VAQHGGALRCRRVAGAHGDAVGRGQAQLVGHGGDLAQGALEVLGDVDREGLEGGDVDDAGDVGDRRAGVVRPVEAVDADE
jgi:hypothetical protein